MSTETIRFIRNGKKGGRGMEVLLLLKCCFTSTETLGLLGTGAQDGYLDFHTAPGPCMEVGVGGGGWGVGEK